MDQPTVMGELEGFADLPHAFEAGSDRQPVRPLRHVMVEALGAARNAENQRRAELVLGERLRENDPRVQQVLERDELLFRGPLEGQAFIGGKMPRNRVESDDPSRLRQIDVGRDPVLKQANRALVEDLLELEVRHPPRLPRLSDACLFQGPKDGPSRRLVQALGVVALLAESIPIDKRLKDSRSLLGVAKEDVCASGTG